MGCRDLTYYQTSKECLTQKSVFLKICSRKKHDTARKKALDYFPYGMPMVGRNSNISDYRFGFNDMEMDNELSGNGTSYSTYFRMYDARLGRWASIDPVTQPWQSPYSAFDGSPIYFADPSGAIAQAKNATGGEKGGGTGKTGGGSDPITFKDSDGHTYTNDPDYKDSDWSASGGLELDAVEVGGIPGNNTPDATDAPSGGKADPPVVISENPTSGGGSQTTLPDRMSDIATIIGTVGKFLHSLIPNVVSDASGAGDADTPANPNPRHESIWPDLHVKIAWMFDFLGNQPGANYKRTKDKSVSTDQSNRKRQAHDPHSRTYQNNDGMGASAVSGNGPALSVPNSHETNQLPRQRQAEINSDVPALEFDSAVGTAADTNGIFTVTQYNKDGSVCSVREINLNDY